METCLICSTTSKKYSDARTSADSHNTQTNVSGTFGPRSDDEENGRDFKDHGPPDVHWHRLGSSETEETDLTRSVFHDSLTWDTMFHSCQKLKHFKKLIL